MNDRERINKLTDLKNRLRHLSKELDMLQCEDVLQAADYIEKLEAAVRDVKIMFNNLDWDEECNGVQVSIRKLPNGRFEYLGGDTWLEKHAELLEGLNK